MASSSAQYRISLTRHYTARVHQTVEVDVDETTYSTYRALRDSYASAEQVDALLDPFITDYDHEESEALDDRDLHYEEVAVERIGGEPEGLLRLRASNHAVCELVRADLAAVVAAAITWDSPYFAHAHFRSQVELLMSRLNQLPAEPLTQLADTLGVSATASIVQEAVTQLGLSMVDFSLDLRSHEQD